MLSLVNDMKQYRLMTTIVDITSSAHANTRMCRSRSSTCLYRMEIVCTCMYSHNSKYIDTHILIYRRAIYACMSLYV